jgi:hypothetical protein
VFACRNCLVCKSAAGHPTAGSGRCPGNFSHPLHQS